MEAGRGERKEEDGRKEGCGSRAEIWKSLQDWMERGRERELDRSG